MCDLTINDLKPIAIENGAEFAKLTILNKCLPCRISVSCEDALYFMFKKNDIEFHLEFYSDGTFGFIVGDSDKTIDNRDVDTLEEIIEALKKHEFIK